MKGSIGNGFYVEQCEVFDKTRFAFIPIVARDDERDVGIGSSSLVVTAALAIRDILP